MIIGFNGPTIEFNGFCLIDSIDLIFYFNDLIIILMI